jgi:hypothetical protein
MKLTMTELLAFAELWSAMRVSKGRARRMLDAELVRRQRGRATRAKARARRKG